MYIIEAYNKYWKYILGLIILNILSSIFVIKYFPEFFLKFIKFILFFTILIFFSIPLIYYYQLIHEIETKYIFFISFLNAIANTSLSPIKFIEIIKDAKEFRYFSNIFEKIYKLHKTYKLRLSEAIEAVKKEVPNSGFKQFLDRLSSIIDSGADLSEFLNREYNIALDLYKVNYEKSLENTKVLQELAVSFMTSTGFLITLVAIMPLLVDLNVKEIIFYFLELFIISNILILILARYMVLEDPIIHNFKEKPKELINIYLYFIISSIISIILFIFVNKKFPDFPIILKIAIALVPLAYISWRITNYENQIMKKEKLFLRMLEVLSLILAVKTYNQAKAVNSLRVYDFKDLKDDIERLYKRMVVTHDYNRAWKLFAIESGSNLISRCVLILNKVVKLGGDPEEVGKLLSKLIQKVLDLRTIKFQFINSTRGLFYGGFLGFVAIVYVSVEILRMIQNLFSSLSDLVSSDVMNMISLPIFSLNVDISLFSTIAHYIVITQAVFTVLTLKTIEGRSKLGIFIELIILMWISAIIYLIIKKFFAGFNFNIELNVSSP